MTIWTFCFEHRSDLVDITGENRILAYHGMQNLKESMRPGIRAMLQVAGINRSLDCSRYVSHWARVSMLLVELGTLSLLQSC